MKSLQRQPHRLQKPPQPQRSLRRSRKSYSRVAPAAASFPTSAAPSLTNSPSAATKATSPSANMRTAPRAKSSSRWPRKAPRCPASWTPSLCRFPSRCNTACRSALWWINSSTRASNLPATPAIPNIRYAKSVVDYIGRWLGAKFISPDYLDIDASAAGIRSSGLHCGGDGTRRSHWQPRQSTPNRTPPRGSAPRLTTRPRAPNAAC